MYYKSSDGKKTKVQYPKPGAEYFASASPVEKKAETSYVLPIILISVGATLVLGGVIMWLRRRKESSN